MRLLLFIDSLGPGGAQRQFVGLACFLRRSGFELKVMTYYDIPFYATLLEENGIEHENVQGAANILKRIPLIKKAVDEYNPDVVISYLETPSVISCILKMLGTNLKLIVSERNTTQRNDVKTRLRFCLFRNADMIVTNSYSQERFIGAHYPSLSNKTVAIPNFVDLDHFKPAYTLRNGHDKVKITIAASVWEPKNTLGFIKAISLLKERTNNFQIKWYGKVASNSKYIAQCEQLIRDLELSEYMELLDKTNDILSKYKETDIFCLPSFYEGTPNVICEAMACGLPIACSNVCDNPMYVQENVNGWLFDPTRPADMADKLYEAISSFDDVRDSYSVNSRRLSEQRLSSADFTKHYIDLITKM